MWDSVGLRVVLWVVGRQIPIVRSTKEVHERTGIDHFMIDSMYDVDTVDGSLEHAREILRLVAKG
ncbi:hypothetical protein [Streptomyces prasinus]|uniref:hypothetical protein n=1 Tax=Streptomyces prasinus TaxID=67345 RepID=UPI003685A480